MISIEHGTPTDPQTAALLRESHALMESLFPSDENHYLSVEALQDPSISFFVARLGDEIVGTGAVVNRGSYGEIKSMFVARSARGQGVASAMLTKLEEQARALGLAELKLETGNSLNAALRLYGRHGFEMCGAFGEYEDTASSLFLEKALN